MNKTNTILPFLFFFFIRFFRFPIPARLTKPTQVTLLEGVDEQSQSDDDFIVLDSEDDNDLEDLMTIAEQRTTKMTVNGQIHFFVIVS